MQPRVQIAHGTQSEKYAMNVKKYPYIDALRGIAILGVLLTHSSLSASPINSALQWVMQNGARGVQLFFVASAITLSMSWDERVGSEKFPKIDFYIRRFFRIAPMFYVAIILYLIIDGYAQRYWAPNGIENWMTFATFLFLHGLHPETINSIVPGGWSIAVEMMFYALFPFIATKARTASAIAILFLASIIILNNSYGIASTLFHYPESQSYLLSGFSMLNFLGQLPVFLVGIFAYIFMKNGFNKSTFYFVGGWLLIALSFEYRQSRLTTFIPSYVIAAMIFSLFAIFLSINPVKFFVNKITVHLGKLSYSMYLLHFAILNLLGLLGVSSKLTNSDMGSLLHFVLLTCLTAIVASVTLRVIEKPGIKLGSWVIAKVDQKLGLS